MSPHQTVASLSGGPYVYVIILAVGAVSVFVFVLLILTARAIQMLREERQQRVARTQEEPRPADTPD